MKKTIDPRMEERVYALVSGIPYACPTNWFGVTEKPLLMDLILPKVREPGEKLPVILWICGGAFCQVDRDVWLPSMMPYAMAGYAVASVDYRVSCRAPYPAAVLDVRSAVRFLRDNAPRFSIDADRIAVMGESAGGYLAVMAAANCEDLEGGAPYPKIRAVVDFYGKTDLGLHGQDPYCNDAVSHFTSGASGDELAKTSPLNRLDGSAPPFLIFHGDSDPLVPHEESQRLHDLLEGLGVRADLYTLRGEGHGTDAFYQPNIRTIVLDFLRETL